MNRFFAPWCGHCKSLKPAWKQATKALHGQGIKLVVVDATAEQRLAQKYEVRGYPTIKIFGENKRKPTTYEGGRDAQSLIREFKKLAKAAGSGGSGRAGGASGGAAGSRGEREKPKRKPEPQAGEGARSGGAGHGGAQQGFAPTPSVELTDASFKSTVLESDTPWLVAFYGRARTGHLACLRMCPMHLLVCPCTPCRRSCVCVSLPNAPQRRGVATARISRPSGARPPPSWRANSGSVRSTRRLRRSSGPRVCRSRVQV